MKNKKLVVANWKMNKTVLESEKFISELTFKSHSFKCNIIICPPFISLQPIIERCHKNGIKIGAQNCHFENSGAFTGEISTPMLSSMGVEYVILGHSERRIYFNETDEIIAKKVKNALENNLEVILCVGETEKQRSQGAESMAVVNQIKTVLNDVSANQVQNIVLAYEPVWAIGTGRAVTSADASKMCSDIRAFIISKYGNSIGNGIRILYGGSVNSKNAENFLSAPSIDGLLVGGASLDVGEFLKIINTAENFA